MYITKDEIDVLFEAEAFIEGQLEAVDDEEYWQSFFSRFQSIRKKAEKQFNRQLDKVEVNKRGRALANERLV